MQIAAAPFLLAALACGAAAAEPPRPATPDAAAVREQREMYEYLDLVGDLWECIQDNPAYRIDYEQVLLQHGIPKSAVDNLMDNKAAYVEDARATHYASPRPLEAEKADVTFAIEHCRGGA